MDKYFLIHIIPDGILSIQPSAVSITIKTVLKCNPKQPAISTYYPPVRNLMEITNTVSPEIIPPEHTLRAWNIHFTCESDACIHTEFLPSNKNYGLKLYTPACSINLLQRRSKACQVILNTLRKVLAVNSDKKYEKPSYNILSVLK